MKFAAEGGMPATVWKGNISFGLVSFPVRLAAAARPGAVHFHMLHRKDESRLKEVWYCIEEDKPVEKSEIVKGFEYAKGKYAIIDAPDLKNLAPPTASTMEILQFVKAEEADPLFFEKSYYVIPEAAAARPYALLWKAMADTSYCAVAKLAMHTREHIVIIRPTDEGLVLHTMYFTSEMNKANRVKAPDAKYTAKELGLAHQLIETLASPFRPEQFHDEYQANVARMVAAKKKGRDTAPVKQTKAAAPVVDILDALRKSLEGGKKKATKKAPKAA